MKSDKRFSPETQTGSQAGRIKGDHGEDLKDKVFHEVMLQAPGDTHEKQIEDLENLVIAQRLRLADTYQEDLAFVQNTLEELIRQFPHHTDRPAWEKRLAKSRK